MALYVYLYCKRVEKFETFAGVETVKWGGKNKTHQRNNARTKIFKFSHQTAERKWKPTYNKKIADHFYEPHSAATHVLIQIVNITFQSVLMTYHFIPLKQSQRNSYIRRLILFMELLHILKRFIEFVTEKSISKVISTPTKSGW